MKTKHLLLLFAALLPIGAWAEEYRDPETKVIYTYTVGSGKASVKSGSSSSWEAGSPEVTGDIVILSTITVDGNNYTVTNIGGWAFIDCNGLTSVTIPDGVTSIGESAFESCDKLTSVIIGNSVTSIGNSAFESCNKLTSVTIGNSVTSIGYYAFNKCSNLTSIQVESGNTFFDSRDNCNAIIKTETNELIFGCKSTVIPNTVVSIGSNAFYYCSNLAAIEIPNSVTSIGSSAFSYCI